MSKKISRTSPSSSRKPTPKPLAETIPKTDSSPSSLTMDLFSPKANLLFGTLLKSIKAKDTTSFPKIMSKSSRWDSLSKTSQGKSIPFKWNISDGPINPNKKNKNSSNKLTNSLKNSMRNLFCPMPWEINSQSLIFWFSHIWSYGQPLDIIRGVELKKSMRKFINTWKRFRLENQLRTWYCPNNTMFKCSKNTSDLYASYLLSNFDLFNKHHRNTMKNRV